MKTKSTDPRTLTNSKRKELNEINLISHDKIKSHHSHHSQIVANNNLKYIFKIEKKCIFYKETKIRKVADSCQNHAGQRTRVLFLKALSHIFKSYLKVVNLEFYTQQNHSSTNEIKIDYSNKAILKRNNFVVFFNLIEYENT